MFVENKSLHYIEADAKDVSVLYRSTGSVSLSAGGKVRQPCEVFVCVVQDGAGSAVYVALSLQNSKNFVIFVPQLRPNQKIGQEELLDDALATAKEWGFEMKNVNLNYSKALKEVVLSDLRVVRQPHSVRKSTQKKGAGEKHSRSSSTGQGKETGEEAGTDDGPRIDSGDPVGKPSVERHSGAGAGNAVKEPVVSTGDASVQSLSQAGEAHRTQDADKRASGGDPVPQPAKGPGETKSEKAGQQVELKAELDETGKEIERLSGEKALEQRKAAEKLAQLRSDLEKLKEEKRVALEASQREEAALGFEIEKIVQEKKAQEAASADELATLNAELTRLSKARSDEEKRRAKEISVLKGELASLAADEADGELQALKVEVATLKVEKDTAQAATETEKSALRDEIDRLRREIREIDDTSAQELTAAKEELERVRSDGSAEENKTQLELAAAREELQRLKEEKIAAGRASESELEALRSELASLKNDRTRDEESAVEELSGLRNDIARLLEEKTASHEALAGSIADLKKDSKRLLAEKEAAETAATAERAALSGSISVLEKEIRDAAEQAAKLKTQLLDETERLKSEKVAAEQNSATETQRLEKELVGLKEAMQASREAGELEIGQLNSDVDAARAEVARLHDELQQLHNTTSRELSEINREIERLTLEKESVEKDAAEQLGSATAKAVQLAAELLETEISIVEKTTSARSATRKLLAAVSGDGTAAAPWLEGTDLSERMAKLLKQADRLEEEKAGLEDSSLAELAALKAKVARLESENHAAKRAVNTEREALEAEARSLIFEKEEAERIEAECLAQLAAEVKRLKRESDAAREDASTKMTLLKAQTELLVDVKNTFEKAEADVHRLAEKGEAKPVEERRVSVAPDTTVVSPQEKPAGLLNQPAKSVPSPQVKAPEETVGEADKLSEGDVDNDPFAFLGQGGSMMGNVRSFGAESSGPPVRFSIDRALQTIELASPEDVLELHQSLNRTRVAMEDNTTVTCDSFLCAVRKDGKPHVYIALYQVDNKSVLVYTPEKQPEDSRELEKVMRDGMDFIEIVGFMMDGVDLGGEAGGRAKILSRIPVLSVA